MADGLSVTLDDALFIASTFSAASPTILISIHTFADLVFSGAGGKVAVCAHRYSGDTDTGHRMQETWTQERKTRNIGQAKKRHIAKMRHCPDANDSPVL